MESNQDKYRKDNPLTSLEKEPGFGQKWFMYMTTALLWVATVFGLILIPIINEIGSVHSYVGNRFNKDLLIYFYILMALYTFILTMYTGISGYNLRLYVLMFLNTSFIVCFLLATGMTFFLILF